MSIKDDNSFEIKSVINFDNAKEMLKYLCNNNLGFKINILNNSICYLDWLVNYPTACKNILLHTTVNKTYPDLTERYIHMSPFDPCSYIRQIRNGLFAGTNTVELDVTAEAVYIYAKYISKDVELLDAYINGDVYEILPGKERSDQKVLMNKWLQGGYNAKLQYNELFPITAKYLKEHANWNDGSYKRNSGLFRDIETRNLQAICREAGNKITNHLHDAVYTTKAGLKAVSEYYTEVYGKALKYKVHEYKNAEVDLSTYEWKTSDALTDSQMEQFNQLKDLFNVHQTKPMVFDECDVDSLVQQAILAQRITRILNGDLPNNLASRQWGCL